MKQIGLVEGNSEQARPLVIGTDTVYIHADIQPKEGSESLFTYQEVQYDKDEYLEQLAKASATAAELIDIILGVDE